MFQNRIEIIIRNSKILVILIYLIIKFIDFIISILARHIFQIPILMIILNFISSNSILILFLIYLFNEFYFIRVRYLIFMLFLAIIHSLFPNVILIFFVKLEFFLVFLFLFLDLNIFISPQHFKFLRFLLYLMVKFQGFQNMI